MESKSNGLLCLALAVAAIATALFGIACYAFHVTSGNVAVLQFQLDEEVAKKATGPCGDKEDVSLVSPDGEKEIAIGGVIVSAAERDSYHISRDKDGNYIVTRSVEDNVDDSSRTEWHQHLVMRRPLKGCNPDADQQVDDVPNLR